MANVFYRQNKLDIAFSLYNQVQCSVSFAFLTVYGQTQIVFILHVYTVHVASSCNNLE